MDHIILDYETLEGYFEEYFEPYSHYGKITISEIIVSGFLNYVVREQEKAKICIDSIKTGFGKCYGSDDDFDKVSDFCKQCENFILNYKK